MVQEGLGPCLFGGFLHFDQIFNSDSATSSPCCSEPSRDNNHWSSQACVRSSTPGGDVKIVLNWQGIIMIMITWASPQSVVALQASPSSSDKFLWEEVRTFDPLRRRMVLNGVFSNVWMTPSWQHNWKPGLNKQVGDEEGDGRKGENLGEGEMWWSNVVYLSLQLQQIIIEIVLC